MRATTRQLNLGHHRPPRPLDWASLGKRVRQRAMEAVALHFAAIADGSLAVSQVTISTEENGSES